MGAFVMRIIIALALTVTAVNLPAPAMAQTPPPISRTIPLTFTGVVTNDVTHSIMIRQPNGASVPFTGPVPDYPYKVGDPVTISFNATVPTQAYYAPGGPYRGQLAADGLYRINVGGQSVPGSGFTPAAGGVGAISNPDVSGPISPNANNRPTSVRMTIVYDANADSYSLEFPNGSWSVYDVTGPSYSYDPATGALAGGAIACPGGTGSGCNENNPGGFVLTGDGTSASARVPIFTPANPTPNSFIAGLFDLIFSGSWNLPTFGGSGGTSSGSSGGGTQIPEPSMMFLFGGGALALLGRRRKPKAT
jgi:PEP-CTERM motif